MGSLFPTKATSTGLLVVLPSTCPVGITWVGIQAIPELYLTPNGMVFAAIPRMARSFPGGLRVVLTMAVFIGSLVAHPCTCPVGTTSGVIREQPSGLT